MDIFTILDINKEKRSRTMSQPKLPDITCLSMYETLSQNLKYYRHRLRMTQVQLVDRAGCSAKYISLLETSCFENVPSLQLLFDLAGALGVQPYQLFKPLR